ncbi:MAG: phage major capsid protein [Planctomycetota bacterium]|jgi:HK97 family phage major capsid protein
MDYAKRRAANRQTAHTLKFYATRILLVLAAVLVFAAPASAAAMPTDSQTVGSEALAGLIALGTVVTAGKGLKELREMRGPLIAKIQEFRTKNDDKEYRWTSEDDAGWSDVNNDLNQVDRAIRSAEVDSNLSPQNPDRRFLDTDDGDLDDDEFRDRQRKKRKSDPDSSGQVTIEDRLNYLQGWMRVSNGMEPRPEHERAAKKMRSSLKRNTLPVTMFAPSERIGDPIWSTGGASGLTRESRLMEARAGLNVGTDAEGGYTIPEGFMAELERTLLAFGGVRRVARVVRTSSGGALPWPTLDDTSNTGELLAEATTIGASVDPTFGIKTLNDYKYSSKPILISAELLDDSAFNMAVVIAQLLGERVGRITNTHFTTGDNSGKPNGIVTASAAGVTAAAVDAIIADELMDLQHSIDPAYRANNIGWMFHDNLLLAIRKLKDTQGQYIWQPGLTAGAPDLLLTKPYTINQDMASSMTASAKTLLYGDFSAYIVRDVAQARFRRLDERYADTDQVGFVLFSRHDGELINDGKVKHLAQAAS